MHGRSLTVLEVVLLPRLAVFALVQTGHHHRLQLDPNLPEVSLLMGLACERVEEGLRSSWRRARRACCRSPRLRRSNPSGVGLDLATCLTDPFVPDEGLIVN